MSLTEEDLDRVEHRLRRVVYGTISIVLTAPAAVLSVFAAVRLLLSRQEAAVFSDLGVYIPPVAEFMYSTTGWLCAVCFLFGLLLVYLVGFIRRRDSLLTMACGVLYCGAAAAVALGYSAMGARLWSSVMQGIGGAP